MKKVISFIIMMVFVPGLMIEVAQMIHLLLNWLQIKIGQRLHIKIGQRLHFIRMNTQAGRLMKIGWYGT
ncbi:hypothetical protein ACA29_16520 [Lederbergia galactosidilytica]|uniref:Uncharacterized protein n=1 Tax=Lederbergia galactosidilytica TaxID=217031 RepID=A0A0Q9XSK0_9BACI|nr:hypothetical protein ACA29_16520 [Lederbergia galactosidilytica]